MKSIKAENQHIQLEIENLTVSYCRLFEFIVKLA